MKVLHEKNSVPAVPHLKHETATAVRLFTAVQIVQIDYKDLGILKNFIRSPERMA